MATARDGDFVIGVVALNFRRRAFNPQEFGAEAKGNAIVEIDLQDFVIFFVPNLGWPMIS
jgi:hypothetical protein